MKTLTLAIDEQAYPRLLEFLQGLPPDGYELFEDEPPLTGAERQEIDRIRARLAVGDDSDFEDWADVRASL